MSSEGWIFVNSWEELILFWKRSFQSHLNYIFMANLYLDIRDQGLGMVGRYLFPQYFLLSLDLRIKIYYT